MIRWSAEPADLNGCRVSHFDISKMVLTLVKTNGYKNPTIITSNPKAKYFSGPPFEFSGLRAGYLGERQEMKSRRVSWLASYLFGPSEEDNHTFSVMSRRTAPSDYATIYEGFLSARITIGGAAT